MLKKAAQKKQKYRYLKISGIFLLSFAFLFSIFGVAVYQKGLVSALSSYSTNPFIDESFMTFSYSVVDDLLAPTVQVEQSYFVIADKYSKKIIKFNVSHLNFLELQEATAQLLGFPVERHIIVSSAIDDQISSYIWAGDIFGLISQYNFSEFENKYETNFSTSELVDLLAFIKSLPDERIINIDVFDSSLTDDVFRDITFNSRLSASNHAIAVLNGANIEGLATHTSRVIKNLGGRVVAIQNADSFYVNSLLVTDLEKDESILILARVLDIDRIVSKSEVVGAEPAFDRADITIVVGVDQVE